MKTLGFITVAGMVLYGQVPDFPMSEWAHVPAVGLLGFLLYWILVQQQPRERKEAWERAAVERQESREHTERVVKQIGDTFERVQAQQHEDSEAAVSKIAMLAENCAAHLTQRTE